jgi:competence protein ComEA
MGSAPDQPIDRRLLIVFGLLIALIAAGSVLLWISRPEPVRIIVNPPLATATPLPTSTPSPLTIYVTGAVASPGIFTLTPGSRVRDAIEAAGGTLPEADVERINLAATIHDGDQIHVAAREEPETSLATPSGGVRIRINDAAADELTNLPSIGPTLAARIIAYREANGPFESLDDLDNVEGVGSDVLEAIADLISFE